MNTASQQLHQLQKQVFQLRSSCILLDHPLGHLHQVYGDCTAGGAGGQDDDEGCPHDATGEPPLEWSQFSSRIPKCHAMMGAHFKW